ncbi:MAG: type II secretion system protein [Lachnospiraceae bacterium]
MKNNRENNKGFTLVELIIVIAVLGILMVALVPQYITYVERARQSNDVQVAKNIEEALEIAVLDPQNEFAGVSFELTWNTSAGGALTVNPTTSGVTGSTDIADILDDVHTVIGNPVDAATSDAGSTTSFVCEVADNGTVTTTWSAELGYDVVTP